MSRVRLAGMTVLLLGFVAGCGTSVSPASHTSTSSPRDGRGVGERHETTTGAGPAHSERASESPGLHREESSQEHSGGTSRGPAATKPPEWPTNSPTTRSTPPPYISRVVWVTVPSGRSLQIYPTANGRVATGNGAGAEAWREVLRKAPDAASAGMRAQFDCHWAFARLAEPNKPSWNLEPWRPVVSGQQMYDARCNPGGPEA